MQALWISAIGSPGKHQSQGPVPTMRPRVSGATESEIFVTHLGLGGHQRSYPVGCGRGPRHFYRGALRGSTRFRKSNRVFFPGGQGRSLHGTPIAVFLRSVQLHSWRSPDFGPRPNPLCGGPVMLPLVAPPCPKCGAENTTLYNKGRVANPGATLVYQCTCGVSFTRVVPQGKQPDGENGPRHAGWRPRLPLGTSDLRPALGDQC